MNVWKISLLRGPLPGIIRIGGPLGVVAAVVALRPRPRVVAGVALIAAVLSVLGAHMIKPVVGLADAFPASFVVWAALPFFAVVLLATTWRHSRIRARATVFGCVGLAALFCGGEINRHYAYVPTLGDAAGRPLPHQMSRAAAAGLARSLPHARPALPLPTTGRVVEVVTPSPASGFGHRSEYLYLPPAWFATPRPRLPVVVMLAGTPGTPGDWLRAAKAAEAADAWAATHNGRAPILVFPDPNGSFGGDTGCVDGPRGRVETYLTVDVPSFVLTFGADPDPARWAIAGLSEGGTCAMNLTLRHPDRFRHFVDLSGDVAPMTGTRERTIRDLFPSNIAGYNDHDGRVLLARHPDPSITAWFAAGENDRLRRAEAVDLARRSAQAGLVTHLEITPGGHNYQYWTQSWQAALPTLFGTLSTSNTQLTRRGPN